MTARRSLPEITRLLVKLRQRLDLSQKDMAERLGITPQFVNDLEHGRRLLSPRLVDLISIIWLRREEARKWQRAGARSRGWIV